MYIFWWIWGSDDFSWKKPKRPTFATHNFEGQVLSFDVFGGILSIHPKDLLAYPNVFGLDFGWKIRWKNERKTNSRKRWICFQKTKLNMVREFTKDCLQIRFWSSIHPKTGTYEFKPQFHWGFWFLAGWLVDFVWFWLPSGELKSISHLFQKENHRLKKVPAGRGWRASSQEGIILKKKTYGCFQKYGYPQIIHFNRVFHYFHHPFWGFSP